ncbi:MAG: type 4a pilus biogenesis protein PilO [Meiothermus sp.]|uniref:type 4a pilus biogenesis protein PilO n=1 Tax=Thermaceae TaxID=188786 RepID=UPI0025DF8704|nr:MULTISPECIES: type 4a pilus biogenesis protein PilO [Thermaceae]MCS7194512.1 type 4a pilus biogenesis protein PilO [Meiothermus sp.]MDW8017490.1 type 4a pilus biogenesis protein PilO [Thermus sp.]MDW8480889.1 type 4a pilus biogenesis protein PilO [Meiothermus sp.]
MKLPTWLWLLLPLLVLLWSGSRVLTAYRSYQGIRAETLALKEEVMALTQRLPQALAKAPVRPEELPALYERLLHLAEEKGLEVQKLSPEGLEAWGASNTWKLTLTTEGPYLGIVEYLRALPTTNRSVWVAEYVLTPLQGTSGERLNLRLTLRIPAPAEGP